LRNQIEQALNTDATAVVDALIATSKALVRARTQWQDAKALPVRIDTVSSTQHGPRYVHLMAYPFVAEEERSSEDLLTFLRRELECVKDRLATFHQDLAVVLAQRAGRSPGTKAKADPAASIINLLLRA